MRGVDAGDPLDLALRYRDEGADEIVIYDIAASAGATIDYHWLAQVARALDATSASLGGYGRLSRPSPVLSMADKVSINTPALEQPDFIDELAEVAGSQCVVVGVDSRAADGEWRAYQYTGDAATIRRTRGGLWTGSWRRSSAAKIVLNCMDRDGTRDGFDVEQLAAARKLLNIPLVASGGAGAARHCRGVRGRGRFRRAGGEHFPFRPRGIGEVKTAVAEAGFEVRR